MESSKFSIWVPKNTLNEIHLKMILRNKLKPDESEVEVSYEGDFVI